MNELINLSGATERLFGGYLGQGKQGPAMLRSSGGSNQGLAPPRNSIFLESSPLAGAHKLVTKSYSLSDFLSSMDPRHSNSNHLIRISLFTLLFLIE